MQLSLCCQHVRTEDELFRRSHDNYYYYY